MIYSIRCIKPKLEKSQIKLYNELKITNYKRQVAAMIVEAMYVFLSEKIAQCQRDVLWFSQVFLY